MISDSSGAQSKKVKQTKVQSFLQRPWAVVNGNSRVCNTYVLSWPSSTFC